MNEHETSAAIADETVIDAIEGAQAVDAVTADESSNPADRRLPLIFRIYGIIMLVEGVVTLPIIVLAALYAVRAVGHHGLSGGVRRAAGTEQTASRGAVDIRDDSAHPRGGSLIVGVARS